MRVVSVRPLNGDGSGPIQIALTNGDDALFLRVPEILVVRCRVQAFGFEETRLSTDGPIPCERVEELLTAFLKGT